jgi:hypothetical protein
MSPGRAFAPVLALLLLAACGGGQKEHEVVFNLPSTLSEVSGLAAAGPRSVFTHDDTHAIVYEVSLEDGRMLRAFAFGQPTIEGDFEGIAAGADGRVFLITSDGLIYAAVPGENGKRVAYGVYDSGVGKHCEIEGLAEAPDPAQLLILCKRMREESREPKLEVFAWRIGADRADDQPWLAVPYGQLIEEREWAEFGPSALEWDPAGRHLLVASAHNRLLLVLDEHGRLVKRLRFDKARHPKVEGLAVMADRRVVLADEGSKARAGQIAAFPMPAELRASPAP